MTRTRLINTLLLVSILFIIYLTFFSVPLLGTKIKSGGINLIPFHTIRGLSIDFSVIDFIVNNIGNIILFVPLGCLLPFKLSNVKSLQGICLRGLLLSTIIECVQLFLPNRWTDVDDIILNTIGMGIGYGLFKVLSRMEKIKGKNLKG